MNTILIHLLFHFCCILQFQEKVSDPQHCINVTTNICTTVSARAYLWPRAERQCWPCCYVPPAGPPAQPGTLCTKRSDQLALFFTLTAGVDKTLSHWLGLENLCSCWVRKNLLSHWIVHKNLFSWPPDAGREASPGRYAHDAQDHAWRRWPGPQHLVHKGE